MNLRWTPRHLATVVLAGVLPFVATGQASSEDPVEHAVVVTGEGVSTFPNFTRGIERYGIRTTAATAGTVDVSATTSDPAGRVFVNGQLTGGSARLTGLAPRDEVSVIVKDSLGTSVHSFIYLPATFPNVTAQATSTMQEGHTLATLGTTAGETARYMAVLDANAVPRYLRQYAGNSHDFKQQPDGSYSVSSDNQDGVPIPERILRLNDRFEQVRTHRTANLLDTDFHEAKFLATGNVILMAYEMRDDGSGLIDSVIQEQDPAGDPVFTWSTRDHVDVATERVSASNDYAHLNSIEVLDDGDLLASFRNISSVFKIARRPHDDYRAGEVIWRLGGRLSDFDFVGDPSGGQCLQHTATQTNAPGEPMRVMVFDNGSMSSCVSAADPAGPKVGRAFSRAVEYELDTDAGTATMVFDHAASAPDGQRYFGAVTGSAYRMANGNTLIGWGNNVADTASTEVTAAGEVVWALENTDDGPGNPVANYGSYRFHRAVTRDAFVPAATIDTPADGATYNVGAAVTATYGCTDTGGSSLRDCTGPSESGTPLDTGAPGTHVFTVTARDGDGNATSRSTTYTVTAAPAPAPTAPAATATGSPDPTAAVPEPPAPSSSAAIERPRPDAVLVVGGSARGNDVYGARQRARVSLTERRPTRSLRLRLENDGDASAVLAVDGPRPRRWFQLRATYAGQDVTRALTRGTLRLALGPGARSSVRLTLSNRPGASLPRSALLRFSASAGGFVDHVRLRVRGE